MWPLPGSPPWYLWLDWRSKPSPAQSLGFTCLYSHFGNESRQFTCLVLTADCAVLSCVLFTFEFPAFTQGLVKRRPLGLCISWMDGWTNEWKQKLDLPDLLWPLVSEARSMSKLCLKLLPALKSQFLCSVEKHQYLDDCIFFPNAHNILCPDNIYGLSSEITNWICHRAHGENVWRIVPHYSYQRW